MMSKRKRPAGTSEAQLIEWAAEVIGVSESTVELRGIECRTDLSLWVYREGQDRHDDYRVRVTGSHNAYWNEDNPAATLRVMLHEDGLRAHRHKATSDLYSGEDGRNALPHADSTMLAAISEHRRTAVEKAKVERAAELAAEADQP